MKFSNVKSGTGWPEKGHNAEALAKLLLVADLLRGRWDPRLFTIGDAVQQCGGSVCVQMMESIRLRTYPMSVQGWEQQPGRTEDEVIALLQSRT